MSKSIHKKLPPIKGTPTTIDQNDFKKLGDFLYHEGPLLSHFINLNNEDFIMKWCGHDDQYNRWMLYKTDYVLLLHFFEGNIGDLELILQSPDKCVYFVDIDNDINWNNIVKVEVKDILDEYLPAPSAFYEQDDFEPYGEQLRTYLDLHSARQRKLYKTADSPALIAAEPPSGEYKKKT